jgi:hypothetical protein
MNHSDWDLYVMMAERNSEYLPSAVCDVDEASATRLSADETRHMLRSSSPRGEPMSASVDIV